AGDAVDAEPAPDALEQSVARDGVDLGLAADPAGAEVAADGVEGGVALDLAGLDVAGGAVDVDAGVASPRLDVRRARLDLRDRAVRGADAENDGAAAAERDPEGADLGHLDAQLAAAEVDPRPLDELAARLVVVGRLEPEGSLGRVVGLDANAAGRNLQIEPDRLGGVVALASHPRFTTGREATRTRRASPRGVPA